jgi:lipoprotein-releasing system ATP-binding protein
MPPLASTLELRSVACQGDRAILREVSLIFEPRTFHALSGDAGCTALLRVASLLEFPDAGEVLVEGIATRSLSEEARGELRNRRFGYVYTAPYLLPSMTVLENVAVPFFKIAGAGLEEARARTSEVLEFAALAASCRIPVGELPWSDQQRVALARGLVHRPAFLIVEHAAGGACPEGTGRFFDLIREVPLRFGITVIAVVPETFVPVGSDRLIVVQGRVVRDDLRAVPEKEISRS